METPFVEYRFHQAMLIKGPLRVDYRVTSCLTKPSAWALEELMHVNNDRTENEVIEEAAAVEELMGAEDAVAAEQVEEVEEFTLQGAFKNITQLAKSAISDIICEVKDTIINMYDSAWLDKSDEVAEDVNVAADNANENVHSSVEDNSDDENYEDSEQVESNFETRVQFFLEGVFHPFRN